MKKFAIVVAAIALSLSATQAFACGKDMAACKVVCADHKAAAAGTATKSVVAKPVAAKPKAKMEGCMLSTKLEVMGMECQSCADKVTQELKAVKGVEAVTVDYQVGQASVEYCAHELKDTKALIQAVEKAGFDAKLPVPAPKAPAHK